MEGCIDLRLISKEGLMDLRLISTEGFIEKDYLSWEGLDGSLLEYYSTISRSGSA